MDVRYDIGQLFQAVFGVGLPIYMVHPFGGQHIPEIDYPNVEYMMKEEAEYYSDFGTPIMFPMILKGGFYNVYDSRGRLREQEFEDFMMPAATLVDFTRAKNIVRTNVLGNNGTVKEIYGFDDWRIRIRGLCLPEAYRTEYEQKEDLLAWEQIAGSIEVVGELFSEKSIFNISIAEIDFQQVQGKPKVIPFEMTAYSDEPIELVLEREKRGVLEVGEMEVSILEDEL